MKTTNRKSPFLRTLSLLLLLSVHSSLAFGADTIRVNGVVAEQSTYVTLQEAVITFERVRVLAQNGKSTYYISELISDASANGLDILKHIPGIQTDIRKSIIFEGSTDIILLVNGRERPKSYISTLSAKEIDRIDIVNTPPLKYPSTTTAVIDIILKRSDSGSIKGEFIAELPLSQSQTFIYPSGSLSLGGEKLNIHTSYSGEVLRFNIEESIRRVIYRDATSDNPHDLSMSTTQLLKQKTWSHNFHISTDYSIDKNTTLNLYANYNPFSQELDGTSTFNSSIIKEDTDINHSSSGAINLKHKFGKNRDREFEFDAGIRALDSKNSSFLKSSDGLEDMYYESRPLHRLFSIRAGYSGDAGKGVKLYAGLEFKSELLTNRDVEEFRFISDRYSAYFQIRFSIFNCDIYTGVRADGTNRNRGTSDYMSEIYTLPNLLITHKISTEQSLKLNIGKSVKYPAYFELNPAITVEDPFSFSKGEPTLKPELRTNISLEHSLRAGNTHISYNLFYNKRSRAISSYTQIINEEQFMSGYQNLGVSEQYGARVSGSFKIGKKVLINPFVSVFNRINMPDKSMEVPNIASNSLIICNTGVSASASLNRGITASLQLQYATSLNDFQSESYSDLLYFVTVEKAFKNGFKAAVVSALPFMQSFIYNGQKIETEEFCTERISAIKMSRIPLTFRVSYSFKTGDYNHRQKQTYIEGAERRRKGF